MFLAGKGLVPTHNSELVSRRLPAWIFGRDPEAKIILASHTQNLAESMSRDVQRIMRSPSYQSVFGARLGDGSKHKITNKEFEVLGGGHFRAVGVGKRIAGIGASFGIIDDYFGLRADAESPTKRDTLWEWYNDDFVNRLNYPHAQIVMATRWHHDDLIGRILNSGDAASWEVIHLPEILDTEAKHAQDPRDLGEPLWPEWFKNGDQEDVTRAELIERAIESFDQKMAANAYGTEALMQGRPTPREGGLFARDWFKHYQSEPERIAASCDEILISVDAAFKKTTSSDPVALLTIGRRDNMYFVLDEHYARMDYPATKRAIRSMFEKWPNSSVLIEDKANGSALISELGRELPRVIAFNPKNESKESRAQLAANACEADQVRLPPPKHAPWIGEWVEDLAGFPSRPHDDRVDAFSQAIIRWSTSRGALDALRRILGR
jgi:predicted phage terminase large subunit-like protein